MRDRLWKAAGAGGGEELLPVRDEADGGGVSVAEERDDRGQGVREVRVFGGVLFARGVGVSRSESGVGENAAGSGLLLQADVLRDNEWR